MEFDFLRIPVIDGHIHFASPEHLGDILKIMDVVPFTKVNLVSVPFPGTLNQNAALIYFKALAPDKVYLSGGLDYSQVLVDKVQPGQDWGHVDWATVDAEAMSATLARQIDVLKWVGFDGLKLIEGKPTFRKQVPIPLDAPHYEGLWAALERHEMPVIFHVADPEEDWDEAHASPWAKEHGWFYGDGTFPTKEALYAEVDHVLARHPTLKLVLAHFYFLSADLGRAAAFLDRHPSVCFDLTPGNEMISNFTRNYDTARQFFIDYGDRLVYGTDIATWGLSRPEGMAHALGTAWAVRMYLEKGTVFEPPDALAHWRETDLAGFRGFALPPDVLASIYHGNFERLFGEIPAALDRDAAIGELARMASQIDRLRSGQDHGNPAREVLRALQRM
ncbi:MAG: amidohydrolase [Anaerolineae bacterium]|jgi:hypothetical protein|nr:amidohydrolase [Anaerolineae bacterium]